MPDYSSTYLGRDPGDLDIERKKKKLQSMFRNTEDVMGNPPEQQEPLAAGSPLGMKKTLFGGGTKAPDLFGGAHAQAVANAPDPYAGIKKGFQAIAEAREEETPAAEEPKKKAPEDVSNDDRATPEEREEAPVDQGVGEVSPVGPVPEVGGPRPTPMPEMDRESGADPYRHDRDIEMENAGMKTPPLVGSAERNEAMKRTVFGDQRGLPPDQKRGGGPISPDELEPQQPVGKPVEQQAAIPGPGRTPPGAATPEAAARAMQAGQKPTAPQAGGQAKPAAPKLEGSRKTLDEIKRLREAPDEKVPPWHKRFGESANVTDVTKDWQKRGQPRGQEGLMAEILGKGLRGVFDKKGYAAAQKQKKMDALFKRYESEMEFEKGERGRESEETNLRYLRNKQLNEDQTADKRRDKEEVAEMKRRGIDTKEYDARVLDKEERGGTTFMGHTSGDNAGVYQPVGSLPIKREQEDIETTLPGGKKVFLKPQQVATTVIGAEQANLGRVNTAKNQAKTRSTAGDVRRSEAKQKVAAAEAELAALEEARTKKIADDKEAGKDPDTSTIDTKIAEEKGKIKAGTIGSKPTYDEAYDWMVENVQERTNPKTGKKYTEAEAIEYSKAQLAKKGKKGKHYQ